MRIGFGISLEQQQKLIMTPELRQAITILQFSSIELAEYIDQELVENPMLEVKETENLEAENQKSERDNKEEKFDVDWQEYFQDRSDLGYVKTSPREEEGSTFEPFITRGPTLMEHLSFQLNLLNLKELDYKIAEFLIGNIDDSGYLKCLVDDAVKAFGQPEEKIEEILKIIQGFEPYGVGARDLKECLLIQLRFIEDKAPLLEQLIAFYLTDLAEGRIQKIAINLGTTLQEVQKMADFIKTLEPKPGRGFASGNDVRYIVADVVVEKVEGEYIVLVNDVTAPRLNINHGYREVLFNDQSNPEAKKYVEEKLNSASWLIKSIEQRRLTIYKVASCLVELQREFLDYGVKYLKPLNLKQVAEIVGVHESTISRATSNKYIQTPQGIFEMKYFFSSGVEQVGGGTGVSSESLKRVIKELIDNEDSKKPLSDQRITDLLNNQGVNISRRTVAKYRDELGILSTNKRKRY